MSYLIIIFFNLKFSNLAKAFFKVTKNKTPKTEYLDYLCRVDCYMQIDTIKLFVLHSNVPRCEQIPK